MKRDAVESTHRCPWLRHPHRVREGGPRHPHVLPEPPDVVKCAHHCPGQRYPHRVRGACGRPLHVLRSTIYVIKLSHCYRWLSLLGRTQEGVGWLLHFPLITPLRKSPTNDRPDLWNLRPVPEESD